MTLDHLLTFADLYESAKVDESAKIKGSVNVVLVLLGLYEQHTSHLQVFTLISVKQVSISFENTRSVSRVSGQLCPKENCPRLGLGFGSRSGLVLGLGGKQTIAPRKIPPSPIRVRLCLRVRFGVEGQFS